MVPYAFVNWMLFIRHLEAADMPRNCQFIFTSLRGVMFFYGVCVSSKWGPLLTLSANAYYDTTALLHVKKSAW